MDEMDDNDVFCRDGKKCASAAFSQSMSASTERYYWERMIIGDTRIFAIESEITEAYERPSLRALGLFVIHVGGTRYGVHDRTATLLANSFDTVKARIARRGLHAVPFAEERDPGRLADAFRLAVFADEPHDDYLGFGRDQFFDFLHSGDIQWVPDGDEAFDDDSYALQFDIGDRSRIIAFKCRDNGLHDPGTLRDVWMGADEYYDVLDLWREAFEREWSALPKKPEVGGR